MDQGKCISFQCSSSVVLDNKVFMIADNTGQLFCLNDDYSLLKYIGHVGRAIIDGQMPQYRLCLDDEKIWMIPFYGDKIGIYDKKNDMFKHVELPTSIRRQMVKFSGAFKIGDKIYCLPYYIKDLLCTFDIMEGTIEKTFELLDGELQDEYGKESMINDIFLLDEYRIAGVLYGTQKLLIYDTREDIAYVRSFSLDNNVQLHSCCVINNIAYAKALMEGTIYIIDIEKNDVIDIVNTRINNGKIYKSGNRFVVVDSYANQDVLIIDTKNKDKRHIRFDVDAEKEKQESYLGTAVMVDEKLYYISASRNTVYSYDEDTIYSYGMCENNIKRLREDIWKSKAGIIHEDNIFKIRDFVSCVIEG